MSRTAHEFFNSEDGNRCGSETELMEAYAKEVVAEEVAKALMLKVEKMEVTEGDMVIIYSPLNRMQLEQFKKMFYTTYKIKPVILALPIDGKIETLNALQKDQLMLMLSKEKKG